MQEQSLSGGSTTNPMVVRFKCTDMECSRQENRISRFIFILMVFAVFTLFIPGVNAGVPGDNPHISAIPSIQELNVTNASFANCTIPEKVQNHTDTHRFKRQNHGNSITRSQRRNGSRPPFYRLFNNPGNAGCCDRCRGSWNSRRVVCSQTKMEKLIPGSVFLIGKSLP